MFPGRLVVGLVLARLEVGRDEVWVLDALAQLHERVVEVGERALLVALAAGPARGSERLDVFDVRLENRAVDTLLDGTQRRRHDELDLGRQIEHLLFETTQKVGPEALLQLFDHLGLERAVLGLERLDVLPLSAGLEPVEQI